MLGYVDLEGDPNLPGHEECMIRDPETGHQLLFIEVPDEDCPPSGSTSTCGPASAPATRRLHGCSTTAPPRSPTTGNPAPAPAG